MKKTIDAGMHTAEHILNGTMNRVFGCGRCTSAHIEKKKSKCDYAFDRSLTPEEIKQIQEDVNCVISSNLKVSEAFVSKAEANRLFDMSRIPNGSDLIRIVHVGDYDACPCIGPHVKETSEIGNFLITTTGYENGRLRVRFKLNRPEA